METSSNVQNPADRSLTMTLRVSADERKRIRDNAKAQGLTVSDYLRGAGLERPEHDLDAVAGLVRSAIQQQALDAEVRQRELVDTVAEGYRLIQDMILADQPHIPEVPTHRGR